MQTLKNDNKEKPILEVRGLTVRYGQGCDYCLSGQPLLKNTCPHCKTVWPAMMLIWNFIRVRF